MTDEESSQQQEQEAPLTVGRQLLNARERQGLDRQTVADQLHLRPGIIGAIEEDNHEALPGELFLKGYVRSYARLLGLDEEGLLGELEGQLAPRREAEENQTELSTTEIIRQRRERRRRVGNITALTVIVALLVWLIYAFGPFVAQQTGDLVDEVGETVTNEGPDETGEAPRGEAIEPEVESEPADTEGGPATDEDQTDAGALGDPIATVTAPERRETQAVVEVDDDGVQPREDLMEVSMRADFEEECWVEIVNGAGERVVMQLAVAGDRIEYKGPGPLEVLLGNVQAVSELQFMGEPVDLSAYPSPGGRAQFVLEAEAG